VRRSIAGKREDYERQPEEVFNSFVQAAKREMDFPPLWPTFYMEEGAEVADLTEQTAVCRIADLKERSSFFQ